jgi:hypothetical protein
MSEEVTNEYNVFLTYMEYFATGEGLTIEILMSMTDTAEQAKEKHLDKFVGTRQEARDYFIKGLDVYPIKSKEAKDLLDQYFKNVDWLHEQLATGGVEFHFKYYVNHS